MFKPKCYVEAALHAHNVSFAHFPLALLSLAAMRSSLAGVAGLQVRPTLPKTVPSCDGKKAIIIEL